MLLPVAFAHYCPLAAGLHPLTVSLVELITEQVRACMKQLPQLHLLVKVRMRCSQISIKVSGTLCCTHNTTGPHPGIWIMQIARSMLQNRFIRLEMYLHKLISPLLTCMVTKRLGAAPGEDHWALRAAAANVVASICATYGAKYPDLPQRISKQLVKAFTDTSKPLTTHYGAPACVLGLPALHASPLKRSLDLKSSKLGLMSFSLAG